MPIVWQDKKMFWLVLSGSFSRFWIAYLVYLSVCKEGYTLNVLPSGQSYLDWLNNGGAVSRPWHRILQSSMTFQNTPTSKCVSCKSVCGSNNEYMCDNYFGCVNREFWYYWKQEAFRERRHLHIFDLDFRLLTVSRSRDIKY